MVIWIIGSMFVSSDYVDFEIIESVLYSKKLKQIYSTKLV